MILERRDNGKAPRGKARSKAAGNDPVATDYAVVSIADSSIAGPSTAGPSRGKKPKAPAAAPEPMLSLYRDDPEDPAWQDDDIEEISSPPPPRRMGARVVPSASQPLGAGLESDIEEVDSPVLQPQRTVTMIRQEDLANITAGGGNADIETICREDLFSLRREVSQAGLSRTTSANPFVPDQNREPGPRGAADRRGRLRPCSRVAEQ